MLVQVFVCLLIPLSWGLIAPLTNPQGEVSLQELARHMTTMEFLLQNLTSQVQVLTSEISSIKMKQDKVVSFKAYLSQEKTVSVHSTVVFDHIVSNIGNGYNPTSGVFHAPISGLYTFSVQIDTEDAGASDYDLISQGSREMVLTVVQNWESKSMTTVIHVSQGDDVFVRKAMDHGQNARLREGRWNQFSGHLLKAD